MAILIGLLIIALGSLGQSSSYVPLKGVRQWRWESFWLLQSVFAFLLFPAVGARLGLPQGTTLAGLYADAQVWPVLVYGVLWGVGGLTFGLSMRYLGVALGQSVALGTCSALGTLLPALMCGTDLLHGQGVWLLMGVLVTLAGIAVIGYAGSMRARLTQADRRQGVVQEASLLKGLVVALLCGLMSSCFALGLDAGSDIRAHVLDLGVPELYAGLPVVLLITAGGFLTNAIYCLWENWRNHSFADYASGGLWVRNMLCCALAGLLWYSQFFGLEMGKSYLTGHAVLMAFSWSILMALNVTFSNLWGVVLKEWKGCGRTTAWVLVAGLVLLVGSIVLVAVSQQ